jgi:hypothetical protein
VATFYAIETEPGIRIPVAEFRPRGEGRRHVELLIGERAGLRPEVESALAAERIAVVVEPRGTGETAWGGRRTDNAAWFFGRPRLGQETFDVLRVVEIFRSRADVASVSPAAGVSSGKVALFAAALDPAVAGVATSLPATDHSRIDSDGRAALADVPGLLAVGDLPQIAALVAPRASVLRVPDTQPYGWTRAAFRALGAEVNIQSEHP